MQALLDTLAASRKLVVITGAGCSTPSGIGDYRDQDGEWKRNPPIQHQDFMTTQQARQRYWARSQVGYPEFMRARPNDAHRVLAGWESQGRLRGLITQNVDRLHQQAGHREVIDLHGRLDEVVCMDCQSMAKRSDVQTFLEMHNRARDADIIQMAPDGDADLEGSFDDVVVPDCPVCGGLLKPNVVFYGDSVPRERVEQAYSWVDDADAVLVVGSSLMVFSSFRFVKRVAERGIPIVAINQGKTRADNLIAEKVEGDCADVLSRLEPLLQR